MRSLLPLYLKLFRNTKYRWLLIFGSLVYILSPFDLSPDILPIAGRIDDLAIVFLMLFGAVNLLFRQFMPGEDEEESPHLDKDGDREAKTIDVDAVTMP